MSILSTEDQYNLAAKVQNLIMFVGLLTPDEVETLEKLRDNLKEDNSRIAAISGTIVSMEKADHKIARQNAMVKRINAVLAIHQSNVEMGDADQKLADDEAGREQINKMFGL